MQGNIIGAGREGSNLSIFEIEKCFIEKKMVLILRFTCIQDRFLIEEGL